MSKDQHRMAVIAQVRQTSEGFQAIANEESALKPPERFQALHQDAMRLYQDQANLWQQWADAMVRKDQVAVNSISERIDTLGQQDSTNLRFHAEAAFAGDPRYKKMIADFEQRNPIPGRPTLGPASERGYARAWCEIAYSYYEMSMKTGRGATRGEGVTKAQFDNELGSEMKQVSDRLRLIANNERRLQPPPSLKALHSDTLYFYDKDSKMWGDWGHATVSGDSAAVEKISDEMDSMARLQIGKIRADVTAIAPTDKTMETAVECFERANGIHHDQSAASEK